jgi:hypothetical protein
MQDVVLNLLKILDTRGSTPEMDARISHLIKEFSQAQELKNIKFWEGFHNGLHPMYK